VYKIPADQRGLPEGGATEGGAKEVLEVQTISAVPPPGGGGVHHYATSRSTP
jgi:hypothetical protein